MFNPVDTYRLQFHKGFTFHDFSRIISYLHKLGISTVYASPVFESTPGSMHGYDVVNPLLVNPEIGTQEELSQISARLKENGMGWLQDIVPNHMAFHQKNQWLNDVLEKGPDSVYAPFFDVTWNDEAFEGRLMVPFLGSPVEEVIENKELTIGYEGGRFVFNYFDNSYPLSPRSYAAILQADGRDQNEAVALLLVQLKQTIRIEDPKSYAERWHEFLLQLEALMKNEAFKKLIDTSLDRINKDPGKLKQLEEEQSYRLCSWRETDRQINYRRFFTVNSLICLNIQHPDVFQHYHSLIRTLLKEGVFDGLRVDHIDGLSDPDEYLEKLRAMTGDDAYIVVEKILEAGEPFPERWPVQGNTGYDFLALVNNLFTNGEAEKKFSRFYEKLIGDESAVKQQIKEKKTYILYHHMGGELDNLCRFFIDSGLADTPSLHSVRHEDIKKAIAGFLINCPVYRYYPLSFPLSGQEERVLKDILEEISENDESIAPAAGLLRFALIEKPQSADAAFNEKALKFYRRCMQFTGPLMAKGVEDTLMYTCNRFVGHNEVGDSPEAFGISVKDFHEAMIKRQQEWPLTINATATHDTKRGEDVRMRLNVLTDLPDEWFELAAGFMSPPAGEKYKKQPGINDIYFLLQTIIGAYPLLEEEENDFKRRLQEYIEKALREGKISSNWTDPDKDYEDSLKEFALYLLDKKQPSGNKLLEFKDKIADFGMINSLAQLVLKFTCPGIPDIYQGCELWDLSLVDPDNRRPVNFEQREKWLSELEKLKKDDVPLHLWNERYNGKIKLWLTYRLLTIRREHSELFSEGHYMPLKIKGRHSHRLLAFARYYKQKWLIVAVPLNLAQLAEEDKIADLSGIEWKDTRIILPPGVSQEWEHLLLPLKGEAAAGLAVNEIFGGLPLAVIKLQQPSSGRSAGVLLSLTSLPSKFGVGDMGPEAISFADFLSRSKQKFWQLLPLSPTGSAQGYSPYSSFSAMAGNTFLISPELLADEGFLKHNDLNAYHLPQDDTADYAGAERIRRILFEKAFLNFKQQGTAAQKKEFESFCVTESFWLDDFALFSVIRSFYQNRPWFEWADELKFRDPYSMDNFLKNNTASVERVKWLQFIFLKQWLYLKKYCNGQGIRLIGDIPFYVSYDSADVWANPGIFNLDERGNMQAVAGVPPDYFNEDGQLWGMPTFRWETLKEQGYDWWLKRLQKNIQLFDIVRLDHFRAFSAYWEVAPDEETARNGSWKQGPAADFFKAVSEKFEGLPFIAEDLGDIDQPVYDLRDEFKLPGMRVLQFAFGDNMPSSPYIPHNFVPGSVVYTGTHDNNTTAGWYRKDGGRKYRKQIQQYCRDKVTKKNIHKVLGRLAYASVAKTVILPMQDILGLDERSRMNMPAVAENNWLWRLKPGYQSGKIEKRLRKWVKLYNR